MTSTPSTRGQLDGVAVGVSYRSIRSARFRRRRKMRWCTQLTGCFTHRSKGDQRVLMKMDIEGIEYVVLPSLLKTGASRSLNLITMEKHRAKKVCPLHFLDVVVSHAQCKAMGRAWKGQFEGRGTRLLYLDDESYAADAPRPLPE